MNRRGFFGLLAGIVVAKWIEGANAKPGGTVEFNRRKFIDASGNPIDLGSDGSLLTGKAPIEFCFHERYLDLSVEANRRKLADCTGSGEGAV